MGRKSNEDLLKSLNNIINDISKMKVYMTSDDFFKLSTSEQMNHIESIETKNRERDNLNNKINRIMSYAPNLSNKLYLSEIVEKENPPFGSNNLILAPTGSGKTTLITERLITDKKHTVLMLVSNETLKLQIAPNSNDERKVLSNRMFTSQNESVFGSEKYKIHVMTYAEFGERMYINDDFWKDVKEVFCDEIHSLPEYIKYGSKSSGGLIHAQRLLFNQYKDKKVYYFTATNSNLLQMEKERPGTMDCVKTFDYRSYEKIARFVPVVSREITHIKQIRRYLKDRREGFEYYDYKGIAFSRRIGSLKQISEIVKDEGFNPLLLWSDNNEKHSLSDEQLKARDELLRTNKIPEPYDFLIYNSAYQEGWDLKDNSVKLAIMNTTNETEYTQALGRLRRDVDLLLYRTKNSEIERSVEIDSSYLNKPLTTDGKNELSESLEFLGNKGQVLSWRGVKPILEESGYKVEDRVDRENGKTVRVSIITLSKSQQ